MPEFVLYNRLRTGSGQVVPALGGHSLLPVQAGGRDRPRSDCIAARRPVVTIGSKNFTEGYVLSAILAQLLESSGYRVDRRFGLGGTLVCYDAIAGGEIDVYPEYSGTLSQAILKVPSPLSFDELRRRVREETPAELLDTFYSSP